MVLPANMLRTRCALNVRKFPFDTQTCSVVFTSWSQASNRLAYSTEFSFVDFGDFLPHSIWSVVSYDMRLRRSSLRNPLDVFPCYLVTVDLQLRRKPMFIMLNGVLPCLVLNVVTIISYLMPYVPQIALSMTCILTYSVNGVKISADIPATSDCLPMITIYFFVSMFYTLFSLMWFVLHNLFLTKGTMPKFMQTFASILRSIRTTCDKCNIKKKLKNRVQDGENSVAICQDEDERRIAKTDSVKAENTEMDEKEKQLNTKKEYERNVEFINYFVLFIFTLIVLASQLGIWLSLIVN